MRMRLNSTCVVSAIVGANDSYTTHLEGKGKDKGHPCTDTEALYRPYGSQGGGIALMFHDHGTRRGGG
jgi:hypothetical protein